MTSYSVVEDVDNHSRVYQYDKLGVTAQAATQHARVGRQPVHGGADQTISAASFYTLASATRYQVWAGRSLDDAQLRASGTAALPGYVTVPLDSRCASPRARRSWSPSGSSRPGETHPLAIEYPRQQAGCPGRRPRSGRATSAATGRRGRDTTSVYAQEQCLPQGLRRTEGQDGRAGVSAARPFRLRAVIFDFDGTLTHPGALDFPAIKREIGCPPDQYILEWILSLPPGNERDAAARALERFELGGRRLGPNAGAEELVRRLRAHGLAVGVLTRNGRSAVDRALARFTRSPRTTSTSSSRATTATSRPSRRPTGCCMRRRPWACRPRRRSSSATSCSTCWPGRAAGAVTAYLPTTARPALGAGRREPRRGRLRLRRRPPQRAGRRRAARPAARARQAAQRPAGRVPRRPRRRRPGPAGAAGRRRGRGRLRPRRRRAAGGARRPDHARRRGRRGGRRPRQRERHRGRRSGAALAAGDGAAPGRDHAVRGAGAARRPRGGRRRAPASRWPAGTPRSPPPSIALSSP